MMRWNEFARWQGLRIGFRGVVLLTGIRAASFWVVILAGCAWLQVSGLAPLVWLVMLSWFLLAVPTLIIEFAIFADVVNYVLTGRVHIVTKFNALKEKYGDNPAQVLADMRAKSPGLYAYTRSAEAISATSPFGPLALWGLLVLYRLPTSAYAPRGAPTTVLQFPRQVREAEAFLMANVFRERAALGH